MLYALHAEHPEVLMEVISDDVDSELNNQKNVDNYAQTDENQLALISAQMNAITNDDHHSDILNFDEDVMLNMKQSQYEIMSAIYSRDIDLIGHLNLNVNFGLLFGLLIISVLASSSLATFGCNIARS